LGFGFFLQPQLLHIFYPFFFYYNPNQAQSQKPALSGQHTENSSARSACVRPAQNQAKPAMLIRRNLGNLLYATPYLPPG